ncbi:MAG: hypothetical protein ACRC3Y_06395 [Romboutsia sp.]|uniref:hypothetical protein n=1 Tax=Romboutsia sp. TaxID=1965302 RepID=UPI003F2C1EF7
MEDAYILGLSNDYTPPSSSFCVEAYNFSFQVEKHIETITKISCCSNGNIEEIFKSLNIYYATLHLSIDIRIDYMCKENNMNFQMFNFNKLIYINLGEKISKKDFSIDAEILDLGIINIKENKIDIYSIVLTCLY